MELTFGRYRGLRVNDPRIPRGYLRRTRDLYGPLKEWVDAVLVPKRYAGGRAADWPRPGGADPPPLYRAWAASRDDL
jgi:hypothetical protein